MGYRPKKESLRHWQTPYFQVIQCHWTSCLMLVPLGATDSVRRIKCCSPIISRFFPMWPINSLSKSIFSYASVRIGPTICVHLGLNFAPIGTVAFSQFRIKYLVPLLSSVHCSTTLVDSVTLITAGGSHWLGGGTDCSTASFQTDRVVTITLDWDLDKIHISKCQVTRKIHNVSSFTSNKTGVELPFS